MSEIIYTKAQADTLLGGKLDQATANGIYGALNPTVASVVRDSTGRLTSATENGIAESVTRDSAGRVATITTGATTRTITRDSAGRIAGVA